MPVAGPSMSRVSPAPVRQHPQRRSHMRSPVTMIVLWDGESGWQRGLVLFPHGLKTLAPVGTPPLLVRLVETMRSRSMSSCVTLRSAGACPPDPANRGCPPNRRTRSHGCRPFRSIPHRRRRPRAASRPHVNGNSEAGKAIPVVQVAVCSGNPRTEHGGAPPCHQRRPCPWSHRWGPGLEGVHVALATSYVTLCRMVAGGPGEIAGQESALSRKSDDTSAPPPLDFGPESAPSCPRTSPAMETPLPPESAKTHPAITAVRNHDTLPPGRGNRRGREWHERERTAGFGRPPFGVSTALRGASAPSPAREFPGHDAGGYPSRRLRFPVLLPPPPRRIPGTSALHRPRRPRCPRSRPGAADPPSPPPLIARSAAAKTWNASRSLDGSRERLRRAVLDPLGQPLESPGLLPRVRRPVLRF